MIHDLEFNVSANVHLDWGIWHDNTWDSDSEDVIDVCVLNEVDQHITFSASFSFHGYWLVEVI